MAAVHLAVDPDRSAIIGPFASDTLNALACFGLNLAIAGALCAAYELGDDPPTVRHVVRRFDFGEAVTFDTWHPGCGWSVGSRR